MVRPPGWPRGPSSPTRKAGVSGHLRERDPRAQSLADLPGNTPPGGTRAPVSWKGDSDLRGTGEAEGSMGSQLRYSSLFQSEAQGPGRPVHGSTSRSHRPLTPPSPQGPRLPLLCRASHRRDLTWCENGDWGLGRRPGEEFCDLPTSQALRARTHTHIHTHTHTSSSRPPASAPSISVSSSRKPSPDAPTLCAPPVPGPQAVLSPFPCLFMCPPTTPLRL